MDRFKPELVIISAGFDARHGDPLGRLELTDQDYADLTGLVLEMARRHAGGRSSRSWKAATTSPAWPAPPPPTAAACSRWFRPFPAELLNAASPKFRTRAVSATAITPQPSTRATDNNLKQLLS